MTKRRKGKKGVRQRSEKRHREDSSRAHNPRIHRASSLVRVLLGLSVVGMALTAYLTAVRWFGTTPLYCGQESSCDIVQSSRWSTLLGLPLSFWGFLTYATLGGLIWRMRQRRSSWTYAMLVACIGVGISIYLTAISTLVIEATCLYCLASFAIITALLVLLCLAKPEHLQGFRWNTWLPKVALSTALVVAVLHLHYSGVFDPAAGPEKPYLAALATHLEKTGAKFYGAYWCPRCKDQKELFEASAKRLPYVECAPGGRSGPVTVTCVTKNITNYPTWIINGRRYVGLQKPEMLARYSMFEWKDTR